LPAVPLVLAQAMLLVLAALVLVLGLAQTPVPVGLTALGTMVTARQPCALTLAQVQHTHSASCHLPSPYHRIASLY
jgi:hypothetical protein